MSSEHSPTWSNDLPLILLQYIHYKTDLPNMKEFTLCMWTKFHNHSNDHPLFSYAGEWALKLISFSFHHVSYCEMYRMWKRKSATFIIQSFMISSNSVKNTITSWSYLYRRYKRIKIIKDCNFWLHLNLIFYIAL